MTNRFTALQQKLSIPQKISIIPHRNPDGDAMGSTLAMYHFLKKWGHDVYLIAPNRFPDFLAWMPGAEAVLIYEEDKEFTSNILNTSDVIFTLDFNAFHRTGDMEQVLKTLQAVFVMIDHHQTPDDYAEFTFSDTSKGSTCEMVYDFIVGLNQKHFLDQIIATCIYTGILTDSGGFKFPKTTGRTHQIVAELIDLGADNTQIPVLLFDNNSYDRLQLLGRALQKMIVLPELKTAYFVLSHQDLKAFNYVKGDTEGIVNYGLSIKGIHFSAIFIEQQDESLIKISFRSQGSFDVNQFARQYFDGGGHINAAGGKSVLPLNETIQRFIAIIQNM